MQCWLSFSCRVLETVTITIFSHSKSEQFWKQNTISTMWFSFIGAVCLFVMRFVKRAIYMQVTSAPSLPKHLIIMRPLKIQIVVFLPVVEIIAQEPKKVMKLILNNYIHFSINTGTSAGTFSISGLKSPVLKLPFFT